MPQQPQDKYSKQLKEHITIVYSNAVNALIDTYIFMCPAVYKFSHTDTHLFRYSYYAARQRAVISVRKPIEPSHFDNKATCNL